MKEKKYGEMRDNEERHREKGETLKMRQEKEKHRETNEEERKMER